MKNAIIIRLETLRDAVVKTILDLGFEIEFTTIFLEDNLFKAFRPKGEFFNGNDMTFVCPNVRTEDEDDIKKIIEKVEENTGLKYYDHIVFEAGEPTAFTGFVFSAEGHF